jgi:hypothetical protein
VSDLTEFFSDKAFKDWKGVRDQQVKLMVAQIEATNNVIRAIGALAESMR